MKGLSLWQPWATLVAVGAKKIETRSWSTSHRGLLAIHATKGFSNENRLLAYNSEPFASTLIMAGYNVRGALKSNFLPLGAIVAVCDLIECVQVKAQPQLHTSFALVGYPPALPPGEPELSFGDYTPGRYAWILANIRRLENPVPCGGHQQLWDVPAAIAAQIEAQLLST